MAIFGTYLVHVMRSTNTVVIQNVNINNTAFGNKNRLLLRVYRTRTHVFTLNTFF